MVLEMRRLRYFVVLAEELSFTRAAERLHIAQPALSQQIRVLEREVGAELVQRRSSGCVLTDVGLVLATESRGLVARVDAAEERIRAAVLGRTGRIRLAYTRSARGGLVETLVERFSLRFPHVDVQSHMGWHTHNVTGLLEGRFDLAFLRSPVEHPAITCRMMGHEELLLAVPADHPLATLRRVPRSRVVGEAVAMWPRENAPAMYDRTIQQIWPDGGFHHTRHEPDDEGVLRAVAHGGVIAVVPEGRARATPSANVVLRHFTGAKPTVELALAYRPDAAPAAALAMVTLLNELNEEPDRHRTPNIR